MPLTLPAKTGCAVRISRADGSTFFAAPGRGVLSPVWNLGNISYARAFASELRQAGFAARVVRVLYAEPVEKGGA